MIHRPAVFIGLAFVGGILSLDAMGVGVVWGLLIVLPVMMLCAGRRRFCRGILVLGVVFLAGAFDALDAGLLPLNHVARRLDDFKGRDCEVICRVISTPRVKVSGLSAHQDFLCRLERIHDEVWQGTVLVRFYGDRAFACKDRLRVTGKISRPYVPFQAGKRSTPDYYRQQGIDALLYVRRRAMQEVLESHGWPGLDAVILWVRECLEDVFRKYLSPGEAGLMNAMLLGPREGIPAPVYDVFRKTGTAHIIAISGMNMTLTAVGLMLMLGVLRVPRRYKAWLAAVVLGFYSLMAGNGAPVARSALMAAVVLLSFVLERETDPLNNLALAGLVILAADPRQLYDVGFQLSFVCVASLLFIAPLILLAFEDAPWCREGWVHFFVESASVTLAAYIGSCGILLYVFGYVAPIGLLVNLPVIPLMGLVTSLGFLVLLFGVLIPWMAWPFAMCLKVVLNICVGILALASRVPVIRVEALPWWCLLGYYAALLGMMVSFRYSFRRSRAFIDKPLPL
ncbi:MAG: ComEC/Rec2 family competence protein [Candidatus Omnitrophota bacterium]